MKRAYNLFLFLLIWPMSICLASQNENKALIHPKIPLEQIITENVNHFIRDNKINISYILERDGKIITSGASGFFNLNEKIELKPDTIFPIASLSQSFAAVTALLLQEQGKLKVTDPLSKFFPEDSKYWGKGKMPAWAKKVTIHHLMTHSHGLPEFYQYTMLRKRKFPGVLKKFIASLSEVKLKHEPGSRTDYSNSGYLLLEAILEQQLGKKLDDFYREEFFYKLGMKNTFSVIPSLSDHTINSKYYAAKLPVKYRLHKSIADPNDIQIRLTDRNYDNPDMRILDTGIFTNAEDLNKWNQALHNGKILSDESYQEMIKPHYTIKAPASSIISHTGYGIIISRNIGKVVFYHQIANFSGVRCEIIYMPEKNISMTILSNMHLDSLAIEKYQNGQSQIADIVYFRDSVLEEVRKYIQQEAIIEHKRG